MKKIVSLLFALSLAFAAWAQNPMDRPMEAFPVAKETHVMCREAWEQLQNNPALAPQMVVAALQSGNRPYSNAVLAYADETAGPKALVKAVKKVYPALTDASKADVLYWIGRNKLTALQKFVDEGVASQEVSEASMAAVSWLRHLPPSRWEESTTRPCWTAAWRPEARWLRKSSASGAG